MRKINIISLFSGRFHTFDPYLYGLKNLDYDKDDIRLIWLTNANNMGFKRMLKAECDELARHGYNIKLFAEEGMRPSDNAFMENGPRPVEHAVKIATLYNTALNCIRRTSLKRVLFLEDDICAPSHTLKRLNRALDHRKDACLVSGVQYDRHAKPGEIAKMFAWDFELVPKGMNNAKEDKYRAIAPRKTWGVTEIGLTHLGGTLIDFERLPKQIKRPIFRPQCKFKGAEHFIGCDIELCFRIWRYGGVCLQDNDVRLSHYDSKSRPH